MLPQTPGLLAVLLLVLSPHNSPASASTRCSSPALAGGVCEFYWHCASCRKGANNPTDCLSCEKDYKLASTDKADCTGTCIRGTQVAWAAVASSVLIHKAAKAHTTCNPINLIIKESWAKLPASALSKAQSRQRSMAGQYFRQPSDARFVCCPDVYARITENAAGHTSSMFLYFDQVSSGVNAKCTYTPATAV
jgi:hypothetical protein